MYEVALKELGTGTKDAIENLQNVIDGVNLNLSLMGQQTVEKMREVIKSSAKRQSLGTLGDSINVEEGDMGTIRWVGVGRISELAPYWAVVNYGGYIPPANIGMFEQTGAPDAALRGQGSEPWFHDTGAVYGLRFWYMQPKSPIRPMNYLETTLNYMTNVFRSKMMTGEVRKFGTQMRPI